MRKESRRSRDVDITRALARSSTLQSVKLVNCSGHVLEQQPASEVGRIDIQLALTPGRDTSGSILYAGIRADVTVYGRADDRGPLATISCTYMATYILDDESLVIAAAEDDLIEFVIQFGSQHTWPYIREFVHTTGQRMLLPQFLLPYAGSVMVVHRQKSQTVENKDVK